jgi:MFS family permease
MAGIGFALPYLPLYLREDSFSDRAISFVSALAALTSIVQFPVGLWSDKLGRRKPFLIVFLGLAAAATAPLPLAHGVVLGSVLVLLFAESGICRATVESLAGASAAHLAEADGVGTALGALRFWRPTAIVTVACIGFTGIIWARRKGAEKTLFVYAGDLGRTDV